MNGYLKTVLTAVIVISLLSGLLPKEGNGKNVRFCARILTVILILSPLLSLRGIGKDELFSFETEEIEMLSTDFALDAFCETLKERVETHLLNKGMKAKVTVHASTNENGEVLGISEVRVTPLTEQIKKEIASLLEIEDGLIREAT